MKYRLGSTLASLVLTLNLIVPATPAEAQLLARKPTPEQQAKADARKAEAAAKKAKADEVLKGKLQVQVRAAHKGDDSQLSVSYPEHYPFPLVSIQFPTDYSETFIDEVAGLRWLKREKKEVVGKLVDEQVIKSTYTACQLYDHLKAFLPEKTIVLVPCTLQTDGNGKIVSFPVNKPVPAVVQVDLFSAVNLIRFKKPDSSLWLPDTFGDKAKTCVSMSMPIGNKRELFAGQPLLRPKKGKTGVDKIGLDLDCYYNTEFNGVRARPMRKVNKLKLSFKEKFVDNRFIVIRQDFRHSPQALDLEALEVNDATKPANPAARDQMHYYGNLIIEALNSQDLNKIQPLLLCEYLEDMAPDLVIALSKTDAASDADLQKKVKFFNHCLSAMREQLFSKESDSVADTIYGGDFGKQYRTAVNSEWQYEKKAMNSQRRMALAMALCGATAGAGLVAMAAAAPIAAFNMAVAGSAMAVAGHESKLQNQLRTNFQKTWGDSHAAQVSCMMTLDKDTIEVRGAGAEEFRKNMRDLYEKRFCTTVTATVTGAM